MTISEEELQRIVAAAVKVALNEIKSQEQPVKTTSGGNVDVKQFSDDELDEAIRLTE